MTTLPLILIWLFLVQSRLRRVGGIGSGHIGRLRRRRCSGLGARCGGASRPLGSCAAAVLGRGGACAGGSRGSRRARAGWRLCLAAGLGAARQPLPKDQAAQLLCGTGRHRLRVDGVQRHPTPGLDSVLLRGHAPVSSPNGGPRRSCRAAVGHAAAAPLPEAQDDFVLSLALKAYISSTEYGYGTRLHCDVVKAGGTNDFV